MGNYQLHNQERNKKGLPVVSAITTVDLPDNQTNILKINEAVYNRDAENSLASGIQLRKGSHSLDVVPKMLVENKSFIQQKTLLFHCFSRKH